MRTRQLPGAAALAAVFWLLAPGVRAAEPDPWAKEPADVRERMIELSDAEVAGEIAPEEVEELTKYWATHLRRCPMNAVESAHYSIAELHLQRGNAQAAAADLQKLLEANPSPELRTVTQFNLGELYRRRLNDATSAVKHYRQVEGELRPQALHYMLAALSETGKPEQAAKLLEELAAGAKEKGEQLALLHRLARLYRQFKMEDQALAVYQRITKEFTPADIQQICDAVVREANDTIQKIAALRQKEEDEAADRLEEQLHRRARSLRLTQRWDELKAFNDAVNKGLEKLHGTEPPREEQERKANP